MEPIYHRPPTEGMTAISLRARAARRAAERAARGDHVLPTPELVATALDGTEKSIPSRVKMWLRLAREAGWKARATKAIGPRIGVSGQVLEARCATVCVAAQALDGRRVVLEYAWVPKQKKWAKADFQDMRTGRLLTEDEVKEMMRS